MPLRLTIVRSACVLLVLSLVLAGCATSTVQSRKQEKAAAYAALPNDIRTLVDQGQIKVGMPPDAVYIAWGAPSEVLHMEDPSGAQMIWLYHGSYMEEYRYWNYREVRLEDGTFLERYLDTDYNPRSFVSAEIVFQDGAVKRWRTLPRPH